jgi:hypothetical protein
MALNLIDFNFQNQISSIQEDGTKDINLSAISG